MNMCYCNENVVKCKCMICLLYSTYTIFRCDLVSRKGGEVAIFCRAFVRPNILHLSSSYTSITHDEIYKLFDINNCSNLPSTIIGNFNLDIDWNFPNKNYSNIAYSSAHC